MPWCPVVPVGSSWLSLTHLFRFKPLVAAECLDAGCFLISCHPLSRGSRRSKFHMEHFFLPKTYDVIVVGAGHAGIEAALAATRLGAETLLFSQNLDTIGQMSCNPAIGGLAKGHIVREIDALGGEMGINADATGIQFRMLNRSKGPSVRAPRVQCDKKAYQFRIKAILEEADNLDVKQGTVSRVVEDAGVVIAVETDMGVAIA